MKFKILLTLLAVAPALCAGARGTATLQSKTFDVDTVAHYYIGPGVTYTQLELNAGSRTVKVFASTLDTADPLYDASAAPRVEIGTDKCQTAETVSSMAKRHTSASRQYLAGVNGDFFITSSFASQHEFGNAILGYPNMSCVIDGKIAAPDMIDITSRENALIIGADGMWIDATDLTYKLLDNSGDKQAKAAAVNYPRRDNQMMIYNSYMGATTGTSSDGREMVLRLADGAKWRMNASVKFIVDTDWTNGGNTAIPADGIVVSCGKDYSNEFVDGLKKGDVVKLKIILSLPAFDALKPDVKHICGGDVRILNQGKVTTEANRWINTPSAQYSRALTGYSQDRTKLVIAVTDAGGGSTGLTYYESADMMAYLGCYDALDLDGGGSTELWMQHAGGAVNNLRDGGERAVGNAIFFTLDAPADNAVASVRFADAARTLPVYGAYRPVIYGYNKYGQLVDTDVKGAVYTAPDGKIEAIDGGVLVLGEGSFPLTATVGAMTATIPVHVTAPETISARRPEIVIDATHSHVPTLESSISGQAVELSNLAFTWSSDDTSVAAVAADGTVSAIGNGTTTVHAVRDALDVPVTVTVYNAPAPEVAVDPNFGGEKWKLTTSSASNFTIESDGPDSWTLTFKVTANRSPRVTATGSVIASGLPSAVSLDLTPGSATVPSVAVGIKAFGERQASFITVKQIQGQQHIVFPLGELFDTKDAANYPVELTALQIAPPTTAGITHNFKLKNFNFVYDSWSGVDNVSAGSSYTSLPLTVGADGKVSTALPACRMEMYTLSGTLVTAAAGNAIATDYRGICLVRAMLPDGTSLTAKAILR